MAELQLTAADHAGIIGTCCSGASVKRPTVIVAQTGASQKRHYNRFSNFSARSAL